MAENPECGRVRAGLTEYLEGALSPTRRQGVQKHLEACSACKRDLSSLERVMAASAEIGAENMPAPLRDRILDSLRDGERE